MAAEAVGRNQNAENGGGKRGGGQSLAGARGAPLTDPRAAAKTRADRRSALAASTPRRIRCAMHSAVVPALCRRRG
eukprot:2775454-Pyramimonas_sp.AAC.1